MKSILLRASSLAGAFGVLSAASQAVVLGQIDTFQDGTTQGWVNNLLGSGGSVPPPENVEGGPAGAGDRFMRLTSTGSPTAGGRMVVINPAQWSGNYTAAGVTVIAMDVNNLGSTDLNLRLLFETVGATGPTDIAASTNGIFLPAGSGWRSIAFPILSSDLTPIIGSADTALSNATVIRLYSNPTAAFPPDPIQGVLGVDNIAAVPEPATLAALAVGLVALRAKRRAKKV